MTGMPHDLVRPPKARRGDRVGVLSPSFAAAGAFPAVHGGTSTVDGTVGGTARWVTADYS
jgi:hypothetical protein